MSELAVSLASHPPSNTEVEEPARVPQQTDRIEISDETKRLVEEAAARAKRDDESRAERVRELRELYRSGALDSEARVRRAAHKLLGGE